MEHIAVLLKEPLKRDVSPDEITLLSDFGMNKVVFSIDDGPTELLAIACPRSEDYDLYGEFQLLKKLHANAGDFFPEPKFFYESSLDRLFAMERLPQKMMSDVKKSPRYDQIQSALAFQIGYAMGFTYGKTGLFTEEPHDGNILASDEDMPVVKLIDAAHFIPGSKRDLFEIVLKTYGYEREECVENPREFVDGLTRGYKAGQK